MLLYKCIQHTTGRMVCHEANWLSLRTYVAFAGFSKNPRIAMITSDRVVSLIRTVEVGM